MKRRIYVYPDVTLPNSCDHPLPIMPEVGLVPFATMEMIEKHFEIVGPDDAELFYGGQWHDNKRALLVPERFQYFTGNESKHIFDVEGDWHDIEWPQWLKPCLITARNALQGTHDDWNIFPTPGISMLLLRILEGPLEYTPPTEYGFYFRGQMDALGTREKVRAALMMARLPHSFSYNFEWGMMKPADHPMVKSYQMEMLAWSFAMCPRAWGHMSVRYYEACALGRVPIVVGDSFWLHHDKRAGIFFSSTVSAEDIANALYSIANQIPMEDAIRHGVAAKNYFDTYVRKYFEDPTADFLRWYEDRDAIPVI
jgi:hypothetical protein